MSWGIIAASAAAVIGSVVGADGAKDAAKEQKKGGDAAIEENRRQYDQTRTDFAPYRETGTQALAAIAQGLGLPGYSAPGTAAPLSYDDWLAQNPQPGAGLSPLGSRIVGRVTEHVTGTPPTDPRTAYDAYVAGFKPATNPNAVPAGDFNRDFTIDDFEKDPGYQFRMDEGTRAVEGGASARSMVQSGRGLKEIARYGQDYASGEFSNAYNRFNNDRTTRFNRLATLAGVGQTATGSTAAAGLNSSNNISETIIGQANARAAGRVGQANAINNGVETLGNYYLNRRYGMPSSSPKTPPIYNETGGGTWAG